MKQLAIVLFALALFVAPVAAQPDAPTPTYSAAVLETQAAYEAAVDALPVVEVMPAIEVTESPDGDTIINIDTQPDAVPAVEPPAPEIDWLGRAMSGSAIVGVLVGLFLFWRQRRSIPETIDEANKRLATDASLQESLRSIYQQQTQPVQDTTLKLLSLMMLATNWTPGTSDDLLARNVNAILTGQPVTPPSAETMPPVVQGPMTPVNTAISAQTPPSTAGMPPGQWVFVQTPTVPQQPSVEAVRAFTEGDTPTVDEPAA